MIGRIGVIDLNVKTNPMINPRSVKIANVLLL